MRNIVLITLDSLRTDHCSCYGYEKRTTPFLDKLARKGTKFENCIVSAVPTQPSSFGMITSDYYPNTPLRTAKQWRTTLKKKRTIFKALSDKYNVGVFTPHPFFSSYYGVTKGCTHERADFLREAGFYERVRNRLNPILNRLGVTEEVSFLRNIIKGDVGITRFSNYYNNIINYVKSVEEPYFLWIFTVDTHSPFLPPKEFEPDVSRRRTIYSWYKMRKDKELSEDEIELQKKCYDGEIRYADRCIEKLWEALKDTDPVFIINSDHGEAFGEHGFFKHPSEHYEYLIKVPMIIYNSDKEIKSIEEPVSMIRLAPTVCDLAGIENEFENPSLFNGPSDDPPIIDNYPRVTVRGSEWKLITNPEREDELYNIKKDPFEKQNLIEEETDVVKDLRKDVESHMKYKKLKQEQEKLKHKASKTRLTKF